MESAFHVMRAALLRCAENALYAETDLGEHKPCPDYVQHMRETILAIMAAQSIDQLAAVPWVAGQAALGAELI